MKFRGDHVIFSLLEGRDSIPSRLGNYDIRAYWLSACCFVFGRSSAMTHSLFLDLGTILYPISFVFGHKLPISRNRIKREVKICFNTVSSTQQLTFASLHHTTLH